MGKTCWRIDAQLTACATHEHCTPKYKQTFITTREMLLACQMDSAQGCAFHVSHFTLHIDHCKLHIAHTYDTIDITYRVAQDTPRPTIEAD